MNAPQSPLHARHYADCAHSVTVTLTEQVRLARDTYRVRFAAPELAKKFLPGQFLMLRLSGVNDPLLGRAFALYDTVLSLYGEPEALDVVYLAGGKFTRRLEEAAVGTRLDVWGPLGNGFVPRPTEHLILVAGGIGQTPFPAVAREYLGLRQYGDPPRVCPPAQRITLCYGARSADLLAGVEDFRSLGIEVRLATDDGSEGHHGLVTDLLRQTLDETPLAPRILCCGPERMMEAVAEVAHERKVPCEVSLETPMACGIGICFSCVAKVRDAAGEWDYKRTCVEGPVFEAEKLVW
jgi:dihydroorotate dehydrogenase electron transfer subunit